MALFDDVLLTVDYDRTLTGPDSSIPQRNLEAIGYFTENGGAFTVNTGRSTTTMRDLFTKIPVNAPFLLYNGSALWEQGKLSARGAAKELHVSHNTFFGAGRFGDYS